MKLIFFTLLIANLGAFLWAKVVKTQSNHSYVAPTLAKYPYERFPQLILLSEREGRTVELASSKVLRGGVPAEKKTVVIGESSGADIEPLPVPTKLSPPEIQIARSEDGRMLCEMVGPFDENQQAKDFSTRLAAIEIKSDVKEMELPAGSGYWVYLSPTKTRQEARKLLSELQINKIDSYIVPKGENENAISLGMFSKKSSSDARVAEVQGLGMKPVVEEIERTYRELWVMLKPGEESKMSDITWDRMLEETKNLQRRQNYCLDVASQ